MMIEILAAGVTNSPFAPAAARAMAELKGPLPPGGSPTVNGELIIALDPSKFGLDYGAPGFGEYVESFLKVVLASQGESGRLPGDRRHKLRLETEKREGVVYVNAQLLGDIEKVAEQMGLPIQRHQVHKK